MTRWVRANVTAYFGLSLTGKTTRMARELAGYARRGLVFDPSDSEALDHWPALTTAAEVRRFLVRESAGTWIRTVRTADLELYDWLARTVEHWRGVVWVLDDASKLLRRQPIRDAAVQVATAGRHMGGRQGVELWIVAHRPTFIEPDIRFAVERLRVFRLPDPADLDFVRGRTGTDFAARVARLTGHQCVRWPEDERAKDGTRANLEPRDRGPRARDVRGLQLVRGQGRRRAGAK